MKKYSGFTLVELMMTVAVVAIVAAIALPSFEDITKRNRATTIANTMLATLAYARSEAAVRGVAVQIGPTDNANWASGWQIIADTNNDNAFTAVDTVIKVYEGISNHSTLTLDTNILLNNTIQYQPSGQLALSAGGAPATEQLTYRALTNCNPGRTYKRIILLSPGGMARISTDQNC